MAFEVVIGSILVLMGIFRLMLLRSGKMPLAFELQRYFPYIFIAAGIVLIALGLRN